MDSYKRLEHIYIIIIAISVIISVIFIYIASIRELTELENILFQIFILATGIFGSYHYGKILKKKEISQEIKPYARPAFRRVLSLYGGLSRLAHQIETAREVSNKAGDLRLLDILEAIVTEQIATVNDTAQDWRDIIPEDVEELERNYVKKSLDKNRRTKG